MRQRMGLLQWLMILTWFLTGSFCFWPSRILWVGIWGSFCPQRTFDIILQCHGFGHWYYSKSPRQLQIYSIVFLFANAVWIGIVLTSSIWGWAVAEKFIRIVAVIIYSACPLLAFLVAVAFGRNWILWPIITLPAPYLLFLLYKLGSREEPSLLRVNRYLNKLFGVNRFRTSRVPRLPSDGYDIPVSRKHIAELEAMARRLMEREAAGMTRERLLVRIMVCTFAIFMGLAALASRSIAGYILGTLTFLASIYFLTTSVAWYRRQRRNARRKSPCKTTPNNDDGHEP